MAEYKRVAVLENMIEAERFGTMLTERGIPHAIRSHHDSAYDGLFQGQMGWGHVEAAAEHESTILQMLADLRSQVNDQTQ